MAGTKEIKRRIKSVKSTKKITKAMELVSASKMKRAINNALSSRAYSSYSWEVLESLAEYVSETTNPLLTKREGGKTLIIFITSNRGLCGGYNSQITRKVIQTLRENEGAQTDFISVGKKGEAALNRIGQSIVASFNDLSDAPKLADIYPIANYALDLYKKGEYTEIKVAYTDFVSALSQVPHVDTILPISKKALATELEDAKSNHLGTRSPSALGDRVPKSQPANFTFEPDYETLMSIIVEKIARMRVFQMILESSASEHSARMLAMKNASDAAGEMIDDLTLAFNKARQANITQEISEISAGMASVS